MNVERQALSGLKWAGYSKLVSQLLNWATTVVVLRILAPSDYGLMAILSVFTGLLTNMAELGLGASVIQSRELGKDEMRRIAGVCILFNCAAALVLLALSPFAAGFYSEPRLQWLMSAATIYFVASGLVTVPQALGYRNMQFRRLAIVELVAMVSGSAVTLAMALAGAGVWSLLTGNLTQVMMRTALLLRGNWISPRFGFKGLRQHMHFGSALTLLRLATQAIHQSDIFIAGRLLSHAAVGQYSVALTLATMPMQKIMSTINLIALPAVARLQDEPERLRSRMLEASRLFALTTVPLLWGMSATAPNLIAVVLGASWDEATYPLRVICIVVPLHMLLALYTTAALGVGDLRANLQSLLATGILLPVGFVVGARSGIDGLASAWLVVMPLLFVIRMPGTMQTVGVRSRQLAMAVWKPFGAAAAMYAVVLIAGEAVSAYSAPIRLLSQVATGVVVYCAAIAMLDPKAFADVRRLAIGEPSGAS